MDKEKPEDYMRPLDFFTWDPVAVYYQHLPGGPFNRFSADSHNTARLRISDSWTRLCYWREICARWAAEEGLTFRGSFVLLGYLEYRIDHQGAWPFGLPPFTVTGDVCGYIRNAQNKIQRLTAPLLTLDPLRVLVDGRPTPIYRSRNHALKSPTRP